MQKIKISSFFLILLFVFLPRNAFSSKENVLLGVSVNPAIKISRQENQLLIETNLEQALLVRKKGDEKQNYAIENYVLKISFDPESFYTLTASY
jgi:hypothetical protein